MRPRSVLAVAGACALVCGVAACGGSGSGEGAKTITGSKLTVYSSLPLQGPFGPQSQAVVKGAKLALQAVGGKVGQYRVIYVSLDDSAAGAGGADDATVGENARKAVADPTTIAYLGELNSEATKISLPILNQAEIAQVSPSNTLVGLTTSKPGSAPGEPDTYYPTSDRTYARVVPTDAVQGAALAGAARDGGCGSITIWHTDTADAGGLARSLQHAAAKVGLRVDGNVGIDPKAPDYRSQAAAVGSPCFVFAGPSDSTGVRALKAVGTAHPSIRLYVYGGDGANLAGYAAPATGLPANISSRVEGAGATLDPARLNAEGKQFFDTYKRTYGARNPNPYAAYGYESMALILDAIRRDANANGGKVSRRGVSKALLATKNRRSVLGTYSIDADGDTSLAAVGIYKIVGGRVVLDRIVKRRS